MSKHARTKGHGFERRVANFFRGLGFPEAARQLEYQANNANGIDLANTEPFLVQCKKLKTYAPINRIEEIKTKDKNAIPVLITAGDNKEPLVAMPLYAFAYLVSNFDADSMGLTDLNEAREYTKTSLRGGSDATKENRKAKAVQAKR